MHDVLAKVVAREAAKMLTLSDKPEMLSEASLGSLEALCRCAKALKVEAPAGDETTEDAPDAADLALVDKTA